MKNMVYFNVDLIVSIRISKKSINKNYIWFDESSYQMDGFFGFFGKKTITNSGWVYISSDCPSDKEIENAKKNSKKLDSCYFLKNNLYKVDEENKIIYNRPYVEVKLRGGEFIRRIFDTDEEAVGWSESLLSMGNSIFDLVVY
jgi:hypothetical protein